MRKARIFLLVLVIGLISFHLVQAADKVAAEQRPEAGTGFMKAQDAILPPGIAKREDGFPGQGEHLGLGNGKGLSIALEKAKAPGLENEADNVDPVGIIIGGEENQPGERTGWGLNDIQEANGKKDGVGELETKRSIDNAG